MKKMQLSKATMLYNFLACVSLLKGLYELFIYRGEGKYSFSKTAINAAVGGDAYNLIINANEAIAYFSLAIVFLLFSIQANLCKNS